MTGRSKRQDRYIAVILAALAGLAGATPAGAAERGQPGFDEAVASVPLAILDLIEDKITWQTSFVQTAGQGAGHWTTRDVTLLEIVRAASPTFADTWLYAFRYSVSVLNREHSLAVDGTICQVTMVYRNKAFTDPTVGCDHVDVSRAVATL